MAAEEIVETVLDCRMGDFITMGDDIRMKLLPHFSGRMRTHNRDDVKFVIEAPQSVRIHRTEKQHG